MKCSKCYHNYLVRNRSSSIHKYKCKCLYLYVITYITDGKQMHTFCGQIHKCKIITYDCLICFFESIRSSRTFKSLFVPVFFKSVFRYRSEL